MSRDNVHQRDFVFAHPLTQSTKIASCTDKASIVVPSPRFVSTFVTPASRGADLSSMLDFVTPIEGKPTLVPECISTLPESDIHSLHYLNAIIKSDELRMAPERSLEPLLLTLREWQDDVKLSQRTALPLGEIAHRLAIGLAKHPTNWAVLSAASLYWRVVGDAPNAVACLRRAYFHSPSSSRDVSLLGLGNVLHRSLQSVDAMTLIQMSIQINPRFATNHFAMASVLAGLEGRLDEEAVFFYETALLLDVNFSAAKERLKFLRCKFEGDVSQELLKQRTLLDPRHVPKLGPDGNPTTPVHSDIDPIPTPKSRKAN